MRHRELALMFLLAHSAVACSRSAPPADHSGSGKVAAAIAEADASEGPAGSSPAQVSAPSGRDLECPAAASDPAGAEAEEGASQPPVVAAPPPNVERSPASSKNHRGRVKELFDLMNMQQIMDAALEDTMTAQIQANPGLAQFKDIMLEFFAKHMSWKSLEKGFIDDYMETFSQPEIEDMIAFYKTPTGAKAISQMPALMKKGSQRGMERVQKHMPELQKKIEERLQSP